MDFFFFKISIVLSAQLRGRLRDFPHTSWPTSTRSPMLAAFSTRFVTGDGPTETHHNPQRVNDRVHSWCGWAYSLDRCIMAGNSHHGIMQNILTALKRVSVLPVLQPTTPVDHWYFSVSVALPFLDCPIVGIIEYVAFSDWLLSLNHRHSSFYCVFPQRDSSLLCGSEWWSTVGMYSRNPLSPDPFLSSTTHGNPLTIGSTKQTRPPRSSTYFSLKSFIRGCRGTQFDIPKCLLGMQIISSWNVSRPKRLRKKAWSSPSLCKAQGHPCLHSPPAGWGRPSVSEVRVFPRVASVSEAEAETLGGHPSSPISAGPKVGRFPSPRVPGWPSIICFLSTYTITLHQKFCSSRGHWPLINTAPTLKMLPVYGDSKRWEMPGI